jgi:hypothetical protein
LDSALVFTVAQPMDIGRIVGIRISFEGTGEIKHAMFASGGKVAYEEGF